MWRGYWARCEGCDSITESASLAARVVCVLDIISIKLCCTMRPNAIRKIAIPLACLDYALEIIPSKYVNTYSAKGNFFFVWLFPVHEENSVGQNNCIELAIILVQTKSFSIHVIAPHCTSFVPFFQAGRAHAS
jgi:hypothetical protein